MANDEYYTPKFYIDLVYKVLETIDLDPASCKQAQQTVKAKKYFTISDNGLTELWQANNIFLNFPYSNAKSWILKTLIEYNNYNFNNGIILANSITDTEAFHMLIKQQQQELPLFAESEQSQRERLIAVCFVKGRINFIDQFGVEQKNPLHPSMFVCVTSDKKIRDKFCDVFREVGSVMLPVS